MDGYWTIKEGEPHLVHRVREVRKFFLSKEPTYAET